MSPTNFGHHFAILRDVHYKGCVTEVLEPMYKCKMLSFKNVCFKI